MKKVNGYWISGHPGSPDPIAEQLEYDAGVIESALPHCRSRELVLQAGARAGLWPTLLAEIFKRVICFEPEPENWKACQANLAGKKNVVLLHQALGASCRSGRLKRSERDDGTHYMTTLGDQDNTVPVKVVSIDSLELEACSAIFLDVEGSEMNVLHGAMGTIRAYMPVLVLEENILCQRYGYHRGDLEKLLAPLGYDVAERYGRHKPTEWRPFPGADLILVPRT